MLYIHATIITLDATRRIIEDGAIYVDKDTIADIGKCDALLAKYPNEKQYDLAGCVVIPGLVSTHVHTVQTLLRGTADSRNKETWLAERIRPLQRSMTKEDAQVATKLTIAEMLKSGTTCFLECMFFPSHGLDELCHTVRDSGIRACLGRLGKMNPKYNPGLQIDSLEESWRKWNGTANDRIRVWLGASNPDFITEEQMRGTCTVARENGIPITIHLSESKGDHDYFCSLDHSPSSYADAVGLLGPSTVLAHAVHVDTAVDIPKFAATGTHVSHCPSSNSKLASGISPVPELLAAGVNVTLGADGAACNNSLDIFQEMKWAAMLQNHTRHEDAASITAETALEMATINGAKALGLDHLIGSLEIGKRADFVAVDVRKVALHPCINPVSNIVYAATGRDVHVVVVDGQVTVEDGKIRTMDEEAIMKMADEALGGLLQRAGLQDQVRSPWPLQ